MPLSIAASEKLLGGVVEPVERVGSLDHELHRQTLAARQRRQLKRGDPRPGNLVQAAAERSAEAGCWFWLRSSHGFSTMPATTVPGAVDLEDVIGLRIFLHDLIDLLCVQHLLLQGGIGGQRR